MCGQHIRQVVGKNGVRVVHARCMRVLNSDDKVIVLPADAEIYVQPIPIGKE